MSRFLYETVFIPIHPGKFSRNFKRPKNREDSSDFDDSWTVWIVMTRSIVWDTLCFVRGSSEGRPRVFRGSVHGRFVRNKTEAFTCYLASNSFFSVNKKIAKRCFFGVDGPLRVPDGPLRFLALPDETLMRCIRQHDKTNGPLPYFWRFLVISLRSPE